ncbi:MAG TPA: bifunctional 2-C-methyl-D-erythritol 4-phosphate cytidylyltransferase/2-C-methyl-D-erythritol 2,4-cyclodiphosphate synthase [Methylomirabilota bacterium]|jgi:2-C-methyl-D-erythritol 4-phosphate cytidylyltransferase / 2-C-methyl-D-erythritol 2,4-cyclodiphosphate synthase|nr:bifunctional 2-C-methyl-D-erythritol 4-phosphate cytidylyltransferase/2-C-methyl-D-erythritol 2,4-cyclodiphosphate synthase [Methylomirabilota bacterium]
MPGTYAIAVAAGRGTRFGGETPKQYRMLAGRPVLRHAVEALLRGSGLAGLAVAIHPEDRALYDSAVGDLPLLPPVQGGAHRQDSVLAALEALAPLDPDAVLIHDGARPLLDPAVTARVATALAEADGAIAALPVADTVKRAGGSGEIASTLDRSALWRAQTPQGFRFAPFLAAHRHNAGAGLSDDAAVAERAGLTVRLVMGAEENLKITTEEDLARAERLLLARCGDLRTGFGFDVHRFGPGDHVMLCGVRVPHGQGLIGHSDADVGLHALTDAVLGAIAAGDIGLHFAPSDARWRGVESAQFLRHAVELVRARGGLVRHLDVTIVCEAPRVGPHRAAMVERIAAIAGIETGRVSVKATTTERLGFTGRGEGIAAQAVATIGLPL